MAASSVGTYYGKYFLLKRLAAGGMGEIFLAKQQGPAGYEKILVIKRILGHLAEDKTFVESFLGEARLTARMSHRNIVQIYDLGEHDDGSYFIAMEYVQGKPLRDILDSAWARTEKMPPVLVKDVIMQCCEGLSYAHNMTDLAGRPLNIIHRDVNPQNLLVSYTGDVKLIDFGIAKSEMSVVKTESGMIKGKFVYMSPEQSSAKKLDKRSDVFAAGIMLYECLCGHNPFQKDNVVLSLEAIQRLDPAPPSEMDPELAPFDPIVAKALAKGRDDRYPDCMDLRDDLSRIQLPRIEERLGQWVSRLFRQQLEEEQKFLVETDAGQKEAAPRGGRGGAAAEEEGSDEEQPPEGGTMIMDTRKPTSDKRKVSSGPHGRPGGKQTSGPHARPPVTGQRRVSGVTGQRRAHPSQQAEEPADDASAPRTMMASVDALEQYDRKAAKAGEKKGRGGLWAVIVVLLLVIFGGGGAGYYFLVLKGGEEGPVITPVASPTPTPAPTPTPTPPPPPPPTTTPPGAVAGAGGVVTPPKEEPPPPPPPKETPPPPPKKEEPPKVAQNTPPPKDDGPREPRGGGGKAKGTLKVNTMPKVPLKLDGKSSSSDVKIRKDKGTISVGEGSAPYAVTLAYEVNSKEIIVSVASEPWAIVYVNNLSKGKTPLGNLKITNDATRIDLKRPGASEAMTIILAFDPA